MAHELAAAAADAWDELADRDDLDDVVGMGADGTPTSRADRDVEAAMLAVASDLGINVLSEEAGHLDHGGALTAVIDPVDGTRNAGRGIPFFCTSVAVGHAGRIDAGVVQNLSTGDVYAAAMGQGATLNDRSVRPRGFDPDDVAVALIADYADTTDVERIQRRHWHIRDLGSAALELCLVGTGGLDAFHVPRPWLRVIDVAAGTLFVREAGGRVVAPGTHDDLATPFDLDTRLALTAVHDAAGLEAFP